MATRAGSAPSQEFGYHGQLRSLTEMIRIAVSLFLLCGTWALGAETDAQRGRRVVDEALAALGGEKYVGMIDRVESGRAYSFFREQLSGLSKATIYTRYRAVPKAQLAVEERQSFGKDQDWSVLFTPEGEGYELTFRGARPIAEDRLARYKETTVRNVFYILRHRLKEPGMSFESRGADVLQNVPVEIVDLIDAENRVTTVYFHRSTKLPVRQVFTRRDAVTKLKDEEVTLFSKYREVNGVQWPFAIQRERNGEKIFEMYADSVTINSALEDKLFILGSDVKRLKPVK
jgi:hypothetical protein